MEYFPSQSQGLSGTQKGKITDSFMSTYMIIYMLLLLLSRFSRVQLHAIP